MEQPGRTWLASSTSAYRYGYNGMERDDNLKLQGNSYTTPFRMNDPRLAGRWWSTDPITKPWESPYAGYGNNPVSFIDPLGLDPEQEWHGDDDFAPGAKKSAPNPQTGTGRDVPRLEPKKQSADATAPTTRIEPAPMKTAENKPSPKAAEAVPLFVGLNNYSEADFGAAAVLGGPLVGGSQAAAGAVFHTFNDVQIFGDHLGYMLGLHNRPYTVDLLGHIGGDREIQNTVTTVAPLALGGIFGAAERSFLTNTERLKLLQTEFDNLVESQLLPEFRMIDPNLEAGYTGSFRTGIVGNPNKPNFGQSIDLTHYDIDFWIKSDRLYDINGANLRAHPRFRSVLEGNPDFEGLKPHKQGFSILFIPRNP